MVLTSFLLYVSLGGTNPFVVRRLELCAGLLSYTISSWQDEMFVMCRTFHKLKDLWSTMNFPCVPVSRCINSLVPVVPRKTSGHATASHHTKLSFHLVLKSTLFLGLICPTYVMPSEACSFPFPSFLSSAYWISHVKNQTGAVF